MSDFAMSVYQSDNKQIQITKAKYNNSTNKVTNIKDQVDEKLEADYQKAANVDQTVTNIYSDIFEKFINEKTLSNSSSLVPISKLNKSFLLCEEFILTRVDSFLDIVPFVNAK